jgi:hypothetical protein
MECQYGVPVWYDVELGCSNVRFMPFRLGSTVNRHVRILEMGGERNPST